VLAIANRATKSPLRRQRLHETVRSAQVRMRDRIFCRTQEEWITPNMTTGSIVLYFNGPFVRSVNGADVRVNALMEFLHSTGHAIHVYSFENHIEAEWTDSDKAVFHTRYPKARLILERRSRFSYFL
jgi:chromosome condensin MukBEF MukE localization factor